MEDQVGLINHKWLPNCSIETECMEDSRIGGGMEDRRMEDRRIGGCMEDRRM